MDTNLITALINTINQQSQNSGSVVTVTMLILAAIGPTLFSLAGFLKAKAAAVAAVEVKALATKTDMKVEATATALNEVSKAVNGGYGAMVAEISQLKSKMMGLEKEKATLDERLRGQAEAKVIAQAAKVAELEHQLETTIPLTEKTP